MNLDPLYKKAYHLLDASKFNFDNGFYDISAIAVEESLYILLNITLLKLGADIPWYLDFDGLFRVIFRYTGDENIGEIRMKNKNLIRLLDDIKVRLGYSVPIELSKNDVKELITFADKIFDLLGRNFLKSQS
ncbi:HEPN domain-containing protein [Sulfolobus tengchongensis]|uniref:HEPN domain-containing protein n=1 Tax=Sulfolobus tengchongensis TaxID=207809 RepID=A0AAX4L3A1_9CREN